MGGHAAFIWPAYGVTAIVMIGLLIYTWRKARVEKAALEKLEAELGPRNRGDTR